MSDTEARDDGTGVPEDMPDAERCDDDLSDDDLSDAGEWFGRYRLRELLGRGGMGEVWLAHDTHNHRDVALKRINTDIATDPEYRARFLREARLTAGLDSLHVIPLHDYGEHDGRLYLDMRLVTGGDLHTLLATHPHGLPPDRAVTILAQIADALHAAHTHGLVHRDVKPANVLLTTSRGHDFAYLVDFGIAKTTDDTGVTATGTTLGTVAYMAPELFTGAHATPRSDIYALGCLLYELLTGRRAVTTAHTAAAMHAHLYAAPPRTNRPGLAGYDPLVAHALAKNPDHRPHTATDLATAATTIARSAGTRQPGPATPTWLPHADPPFPPPSWPPAAAPPSLSGPLTAWPPLAPYGAYPTPPRPPRRRWWIGALTAVVLLVVTGTAVVLTDEASPPPGPPPRVAQIAARPLPTVINNGDDLVIAQDGTRAYVAAAGNPGAPSNSVHVVDLPSGRISATIAVGDEPWGLVLSPDERTLYAAVRTPDTNIADQVAVVDTATNQVVGAVPVGQRPAYPGLSPDGRTLYSPEFGYGNAPSTGVSVIDAVQRTNVRTIPIGDGPWAAQVTPDGRTAYISRHRTPLGDAQKEIAVLDTSTGTVIGSIPVGAAPTTMALVPGGGTLYIAHRGTTESPVGSVSVVDTATRSVRTIIHGDRIAPFDVVLAPDGTRALAVTPGNDAAVIPSSVAVIDTASNTIIAATPLGRGAFGAAFTPDGRQAYVTTDTGLWVVDVP